MTEKTVCDQTSITCLFKYQLSIRARLVKTRDMVIYLSFFLLHLQGCALMLGAPIQSLAINSQPNEALINVVDENGIEVFKGKTPAVIPLDKGTGNYFGSKTYLVHISKQGYQPQIFPVVSVPNNYYLYGNFFTVYIGWLLVDPFFPNMYNLEPESINTTLEHQ